MYKIYPRPRHRANRPSNGLLIVLTYGTVQYSTEEEEKNINTRTTWKLYSWRIFFFLFSIVRIQLTCNFNQPTSDRRPKTDEEMSKPSSRIERNEMNENIVSRTSAVYLLSTYYKIENLTELKSSSMLDGWRWYSTGTRLVVLYSYSTSQQWQRA